MSIPDRLRPHRSNNFDLLRLALAALVVLNHSYGLLYGPSAREPLVRLTRGQLGFGDLAVDGFFVISGFLITASWINTADLFRFISKRMARIYPGIAVAILFCLLVAAPLGADHPIEYLRGLNPVTYLRSLAQLQIPEQNGVFSNQAYPGILNLPLWTIRYECLCYLMVAALGLAGFLKKPKVILLLFAAAWMAYGWQSLAGGLPMLDWRHYPILGRMQPWPRFLAFYFAGMVFSLYRARIPLRTSYLWISAALVMLSLRTGLALTLPVFGAYLLMCAAFSPVIRFPSFGKRGDFSYGTYIYACPAQQLLIHYLQPHLTPASLFFLSLMVTLPLAAASWHLVESPCLRLIQGIGGRSVRQRPESTESPTAPLQQQT
jgi:peptidoglycan/LPS O-acetylase OafA/YrhL